MREAQSTVDRIEMSRYAERESVSGQVTLRQLVQVFLITVDCRKIRIRRVLLRLLSKVYPSWVGISRYHSAGLCALRVVSFSLPAQVGVGTGVTRSHQERGRAVKTSPWHSVKTSAPQVHHNNTACTEGNNIERENRREGTGGRPLCNSCARF